MSSDVLKPVKAQLDAYNAQDLDLFVDQYHDQIELNVLDGDMQISGKEQMREWYGKLFAENPNGKAEVSDRWVVGNYVLDLEIITGQTGQSEEIKAVAIFLVDGDLIRRATFVM